MRPDLILVPIPVPNPVAVGVGGGDESIVPLGISRFWNSVDTESFRCRRGQNVKSTLSMKF